MNENLSYLLHANQAGNEAILEQTFEVDEYENHS